MSAISGGGVLSGLRFIIRNSGTIIQITAASFGPVGGPIAGATVAAFQTANRGGSIGDAIKAGAVSYITAQAFSAVGDATGGHGVGVEYLGNPMYPVNVAGHALVGCASSVAQGGKCGPGALSAGLSGAAGPMLNNVSMESGTAISAVLGGIGSSIGGGKFANGALTGAYGYLFNSWLKKGKEPNDQHAIGVDRVAQILEDQGYNILGFEVKANIEGLSPRVYDILVQYPGMPIAGVEVKTSIVDLFTINPVQAEFDKRAVQFGAQSTYGIIRGIQYTGVCFGCGLHASWRSYKLQRELENVGIHPTIIPPQRRK